MPQPFKARLALLNTLLSARIIQDLDSLKQQGLRAGSLAKECLPEAGAEAGSEEEAGEGWLNP